LNSSDRRKELPTRIAWFVVLWFAGIAAVGVLAALIRALLQQ
jgi:hypothetical protein